MSSLHFPRHVTALLCLLAISSSELRAEDTTVPDAKKPNTEAVELATVEVTADQPAAIATSGVLGTRSVLDTPYSVSVVGRDELDRWQPKTIGEVFFADPSVVSTVAPQASGWRERVTVRGLGLNWNNYRLNGLPVETTTAEWPLDLMEQVELFKGVNGFMHGFGRPGGMVNYQTKQPLDRDYTATTVGFYSDSILSGSLDVSRRAGKDGWLGYRVNLGREFGETYAKGDLERNFGSLALDARVTENLTLTAEFIHIVKSLDGEAAHVYYSGLPAGSALPSPIDVADLDTVAGTFDDVSNTVAMTGLEYRINPDWTTSVDYAYFRGRNDINKAFYTLTNSLGDYNINAYQLSWDETDSNIVQSLTEGKFDTGPFNHHLVAGASWQSRRTFSTAYDWTLIGTGNLYTGNGPLAPLPPHSNNTNLTLDVEQASLFASDTVEFLPGLSGLLGLRYNDYEQQAPGGAAYTTDLITPTYAVIYKPRADLTLYVSYVEALETGSTVGASSGGLPYTNAGEVLPPLVSEQTEVGLKYESRRWAAGIAAFRLERGSHITNNNGDGTVTLLQDGIDLY
jgi:iron complex outermembrane recepter protein